MQQSAQKPRRILLLTVAVLGLIVIISLAMSGRSVQNSDDSAVEYGVSVLRQMEAGNPDDVVKEIRQQQIDKLLAEGEEYTRKLQTGEIDVWSQFQDYVILGDSRGVGFSTYEFLPTDRNLSVGSETIRNISDHMPDVIALHPSRVYITYGVNDINIGYWKTSEEYTEEFVDILEQLRSALPDAEIYVNSILEVRESDLDRGEMWKYIPDWNAALKQMCQDHGYTFIDNSSLTADHQDLYNDDGVHFARDFYPYWAINMISATYFHTIEEAMQ